MQISIFFFTWVIEYALNNNQNQNFFFFLMRCFKQIVSMQSHAMLQGKATILFI